MQHLLTQAAALRPEQLARLTAEERDRLVGLASRARYLWRLHARPEQLAPPGAWFVWLILAGRGWGKTRTAAEWVREQVEHHGARRVALVGRTAADTRDVMVEGDSGLLGLYPEGERPIYESSKRRVTFRNGAIATLYSADEPNLLRGPQHDAAWADELAAWQRPDAWDQLLFGLRLGASPRVVVATTPRPTPTIRGLVAQSPSGRVAVTRGSTYDNAANLAPTFLEEVRKRYEGTRLGRQELFAEVLDDTPGALWTRAQLDDLTGDPPDDLRRIVVAVDPSVAADGGGDEAGIVVAGVARDGTAWVLRDESANLSPDAWARRAVSLYREYGADRIVAEANQGGALVEHTLRSVDRNASVRLVHASKGKRARAEPVAALYEQKRVRHARGLARLEDQQCTWAAASGDPSPNRVDALVWAVTDLVLEARPASVLLSAPSRR